MNEERVTSKSLNRRGWLRTVINLLTASTIATLLYFTILVTAWKNIGGDWYVFPERFRTAKYLAEATGAIKVFQEENKTLPDSLPEAFSVVDNHPFMRNEKYSNHKDGWGNPIQYQKQGDEFEVWSLGMDGEVGGTGLNADVYPDSRNADISQPTFQQFFREGNGMQGIVDEGAWFSLVVAVLLFVALNRSVDPNWYRAAQVCYSIFVCIVVFISALVLGVILTPLHIPSGH